MSATFQEAQAASFYTGSDIFSGNDVAENHDYNAPADDFTFKVKRATKAPPFAKKFLHRLSSTQLRHSNMFGLVETFLKDINTFAYTIQFNNVVSSSPRDTMATIAGYMPIEDITELTRFIARNQDIADVLENAVAMTATHPKYTTGQVAVFSDPGEKDYCLYINAQFSMDSYEQAYNLEGEVFDKVINPHFDMVNFRIMLSFDTDSDD